MQYLLAIDTGTTSVKTRLFSPGGRCLGLGREEYQLETPATDRAVFLAERFVKAAYSRTGIPEIVPTWPGMQNFVE